MSGLPAIEIAERKGNRVTVRVPLAAYHNVPPPADAHVAPDGIGRGYVSVIVSRQVERGIRERHPILSDPERLAEATFAAEARGQYVWDIDFAIADGCPPHSEAVRSWRAANGVSKTSKEWPTRHGLEVRFDVT